MIAILWHMHQPDYRDAQGRFFMPWVFLHAIKDYYDMPWIASQFGVKVTFNLTPVLLEQLRRYETEGCRIDRFLDLWMRDPSALADQDRAFVLKICKSLRFETMVRPYEAFAKLYGLDSYSDEELMDLEMWALLGWCGTYLKRHDPTIKGLIQKGRGFNEEDKKSLLDALFVHIKRIVPLYGELRSKGMVEITTTPYTHPILPLLLDMQNATRANPTTQIPHNHRPLREDARLHIQRAIACYEDRFGEPPKGFWPAEGAVDEKSVSLYEEHGIGWVATDEAILHKSGGSDPYQAYRFGGVRIFFRDRALSDAIGFHYRYLSAKDAVERFWQEYRSRKGELVSVILDGENAWEYYPNNGYDFLCGLYERIAGESCTFGEAAQREAARLDRLEPGSWVDGDFTTWVGDEEKNRAWELLFETKGDIIRHGIQSEEIEAHFLAAEASDWFWWYGAGHYTEFAYEFDELFRGHLKRIYELADLPVPSDLLEPIVGAHAITATRNEPKAYIEPIIDGKITSFFEWIDAGYIDERMQGSMAHEVIVYRLFWGESRTKLYFRLDFVDDTFDLALFVDEERFENFEMKKDEIVEIAIEKEALGKRRFEVRFEVIKDKKVAQIVPGCCRLDIEIDKEYLANWFV